MTDLTPTHTETYVYIEEIAVPFSYPVTFTRNAFDPANPVLADAVDGRMLAYVDSGLAEAQPELPDALAAYAAAHALDLLTPPRILPGGETAKDGWDVVNGVIAEIVKCQETFASMVPRAECDLRHEKASPSFK